ncbi:MAG: 30S ribosomal protein S16 [Candidatus Shapirobacteria bacterium]|nr:30S ribosomal protein S16 [Candidatus Shapirobacteria bacterium]MDD4410394.1 30S ribosomal protein S16 [Candidatus Shapirobacteria bacterium]
MLKIKLAPRGKTHQITYRIVIAEDRSKLNGPVIDDLGFYTPQTKTIEVDKQKMADWIKKGAQVTFGVDRLLNPDKYPKKVSQKVKKEKTEEIKEEVKTEEIPVEEVQG